MRMTMFIIAFLFCIGNVEAQGVKGKVVDENKEPVEYASVLLMQGNDSSFVRGTVSDKNGDFFLPYVGSIHDYFVKIKCLGFTTQTLFNLSKDSVAHVFVLPRNTVMLNDVVINGQRKNIRKINGGLSIGIANSYLKDIGNAFDVLEHLPLVINNNDEIQIMGKGKPIIYVDNRLIKNTRELERLFSKDIRKIDVINMPGSEYPSSAKAVIKIYTSKSKAEGLSFDAQTYIMRKDRFSEYLNGNIAYKIKWLNIFMNGDVLNGKGDYTRKTYYVASLQNSYEGKVANEKRNKNYSIGFNFDLSKHCSFGVRYEKTKMPNCVENKRLLVNDANILYSSMDTTSSKSNNNYLNAYLTGSLSSLLYEFNVDYNKGRYNLLSDISESNKVNQIKYESNNSYEQTAAKMKFSIPITCNNPITFGAEYNKTSFFSFQKVLNSNEEWGLSDAENKNYQYLYAGFVEYHYKWGNFQASVGSRVEYSQSDYYENKEKIDEQSKKYLSFLPTLSLGCQIRDWGIEINAQKHVERPSYKSLSNTTTYTSNVTRWQGNPFLHDTKEFEFDVSATSGNLYLSMGYQRTTNQIFEVNLPSETSSNIIIVKPINLPAYNTFSVEASWSFDWKFIHPNFDLNLQYQDLKYGNPVKEYNKPIAELMVDNRISLGRNYNLWISFNLRSKGNYATGYTYGYENLGFTISKNFFKKSLTIRLQCKDILNRGREKIEINTNNLYCIDKSVGNTRCVKLTISYNFNKSPKKYKGKNISSKELNRIKRQN